MTTWLALDCSCLGYRALHSTGELRYEDEPTGVVYGILRETAALCVKFETRAVIPCFDVGKSLREEVFPYYKETRRRKVYTDDQQRQRDELHAQLKKLRTGIFEEIGVTNSLWKKGLEADDMLAVAARSIPRDDRIILVTSDQDMYQLLDHRTAVYNPHTKALLTAKWFRREKGIRPDEWVRVKCLAGCGTDDVPGVEGVAEATAIKFIKGELKQNTLWRRIQEFKSSPQYADNVKLVSLQHGYWDTPARMELDPAGLVNPTMWDLVVSGVGMDTLVNAFGGKSVRGSMGA